MYKLHLIQKFKEKIIKKKKNYITILPNSDKNISLQIIIQLYSQKFNLVHALLFNDKSWKNFYLMKILLQVMINIKVI